MCKILYDSSVVDWWNIGAEIKHFDANDYHSIEIDDKNYVKVMEVYEPLNFPQYIGYAKFKCKEIGPVLYRGQANIYKKMSPSLFRELSNQNNCGIRRGRLKKLIENLRKHKVFMKSTEEFAYEPLLQHYGVNTEYIDVVDNIWSALWFATHSAVVCGKNKEYVTCIENLNEYCYILMLQFGKYIENSGCFSNYNTDKGYHVVDLRMGANSLYRRPHAQHGLLAKKQKPSLDYSDSVVGILRINTKNALSWIGNTPLMQTSFMFPSAFYDKGYSLFLESNKILEENKSLYDDVTGRIQIIMP